MYRMWVLIIYVLAAGLAAQEAQLPAAEISSRTALLMDSRVPISLRKAEIRSLARQGDARAAAVLMDLASRKTYLNRYAAEALGDMRSTADKKAVRLFLIQNLNNPDARYASACVRALARLDKAAAVQTLGKVFTQIASRDDGYHEMIASAAVKALGRIGSDEAVHILCAQLDRPGQGGWTWEYGSRILTALEQLGSSEAGPAIQAYIIRMQTMRPDDPMAGAYFDRKIAEAQRIADNLSRE